MSLMPIGSSFRGRKKQQIEELEKELQNEREAKQLLFNALHLEQQKVKDLQVRLDLCLDS